MLLRRSACVIVTLILLIALPLDAKVVRVEVASRADLLDGKAFGETGAYERLVGKVYFSVPVANRHNQPIVDLGNAVNLRNGEVEFSADFVAIRPKDPKKGNGSMILEVPNRGHGRITGLVDGGDWDVPKDAGDAWLLRNGFTIVTLGWQWDAVGDDALRLYAPLAKENGRTITGLLRGDYMPYTVMPEIPLGHYFMRGVIGGSLSQMKKGEARQKLAGIIAEDLGVRPIQHNRPDPETSFGWFVRHRYLPMREGRWHQATKEKTTIEINRYWAEYFKNHPLGEISQFELQVHLNNLAKEVSDSIVRHAFSDY